MCANRIHNYFIILLFGLGCSVFSQTNSSPAGMQPAPFTTLRLNEAKQMAFQNNWDLLAMKSELDLATAQRIVAGEFPNPTLSLGTTKMDVDRSSATTI